MAETRMETNFEKVVVGTTNKKMERLVGKRQFWFGGGYLDGLAAGGAFAVEVLVVVIPIEHLRFVRDVCWLGLS